MMDGKDGGRLSVRLQTILSLVPECGTAADIGCDHGLLSIELIQSGRAKRVIASDLRKGPLMRAEKNVSEAGLSDRIRIRLGDGLKTLSPGEAETVIIAGMGGPLLEKILTEGGDILKDVRTLILSPHTEIPSVRRFLEKTAFRITEEKITKDAGKTYFVLKAENEEFRQESSLQAAADQKGAEKKPNGSPELLHEFGLLLFSEDPLFREWLENEERKTEALLAKLNRRLGEESEEENEREENTEDTPLREAIRKADASLSLIRRAVSITEQKL